MWEIVRDEAGHGFSVRLGTVLIEFGQLILSLTLPLTLTLTHSLPWLISLPPSLPPSFSSLPPSSDDLYREHG